MLLEIKIEGQKKGEKEYEMRSIKMEREENDQGN